MSSKKIKILLIGYLPPPIGGVTVLFKQLVDEISRMDEVDIWVVDLATDDKRLLNKIKVLYNALSSIVYKIKDVDVVSLHAVTGSTVVLGPIVYILSKIFRKKIIIREFGGVFHEKYKGFSPLVRYLLKFTIFKSDIFLLETQKQVLFFKNKGYKNILWYPNSRQINNNEKEILLKNQAKKFVFISQMKKSKGVEEIFFASENLPKDISIDLYGPLGYDLTNEKIQKLNKKYNAKYLRSLKPSEVNKILKNYDVLLLPTYHEGEGYPGIILEAYSLGIPVISTQWNAIPEIVDKNSGILITPKNVNELHIAIQQLYENKQYYNGLQIGSRAKAQEFSSVVWSEKFVKLCKGLV